jgi:hypothetical protein
MSLDVSILFMVLSDDRNEGEETAEENILIQNW